MACYIAGALALWDVGAADKHGDVDVFFVGAAFAGWQTVLTDVETWLVGCVSEVAVDGFVGS